MAFNFNVKYNSGQDFAPGGDDNFDKDFDDYDKDLDDLWTTDGNETDRTISTTPIRELLPQDIAVYDSRNESVILSKTNALHRSLYFCEQIVDACFQVSNYIPDLSTDQNAQFWRKDVIPLISGNIVNVGRARVIVSHSISSVRQLGIAIFKGAEIINETRGSAKSVEIARKHITASLAALDRWIEETEKLESTLSIAIFEKQISEVFEIMGPESSNFLEEISDIEAQVYAAEAKQKQHFVDIGRKKGELAGYRQLYRATKRYLDRLNKTVETNEVRIDTLGRRNEKTEETLQSIQESTTAEHRKWWRWWSNKEKNTEETCELTQNSERDRGKEYYEGMVLARMKRLREEQNDVNCKRTIVKSLHEDLFAYSGAIETAEAELSSMNNDFKIRLAEYQKDVDSIKEKLKEAKGKRKSIENNIGLQGDALTQCLTAIRTFGKTIERGTSAFSPLVAILGDIRQMVLSDIELLSSDSETDINIAARRLLNQVQFITRYAVDANEILNPSSEILPIEASITRLAILDSANAQPHAEDKKCDSVPVPKKRHVFLEENDLQK